MHDRDDVKVCHEASGVIGVWKPGGLPSQAPPGIDSVEMWLRDRLGPGRYLGIPHRLDRAVSGIMLFASTPRAARQLSRQFERRTVQKTYLAVVDATATPEPLVTLERDADGRATWEDRLEKVPDEPRARIVMAGGGKPAITHVRLLGRTPSVGGAILELQPHTGRMHQLRVQAAARGLPIVGDLLYGGPAATIRAIADPRAGVIALHAWRITFTDPDTKAPLTLEAPLPTNWPADVVAAIKASEA